MSSESQDLAEFRHVLRELVRMLRMPVRDLERTLEIGHGKLELLLNGELEIRLRHVLAMAEVLGVSPGDLLTMGCAEAHAARPETRRRLAAPSRPEAGRGSASGDPGGARLRETLRFQLSASGSKIHSRAP